MINQLLSLFQTRNEKAQLSCAALSYLSNKGEDPSFENLHKRQLSKLSFPRTDQMNIGSAKRLLSGSFLAERYYLVVPISSVLSKAGSIISIAFAKSLTNPNTNSLIAYPEKEDLRAFRHASKRSCFYGAPGDRFHGSIGELLFRIEENCINVDFLQSSVNYAKAIKHQELDPKYNCKYSAWATSLITHLFSYAETIGSNEILLPDNKILASIGDKKLQKIAQRYNFKLIERATVTDTVLKKAETKIYFKKQV